MIPLHVHSCYSLLQSSVRIDELLNKAAQCNLSSIALTDTDAMYGLIHFAKKAIERNIKPILGAQITQPGSQDIYALLLAKSIDGYKELCRIITARQLNDNFNLVEALNQRSENLFVISNSILLLKQVKDFENVYCELIDSKNSKRINRELFDFSTNLHIPVVVTNPVYFLNKDDYYLHKTLCAIRLNKNVDDLLGTDYMDSEFYFKSPAEIDSRWKNLAEAVSNTNKIATECNVDLKFNQYKFPKFKTPGNLSSHSMLREISYSGLKKRYPTLPQSAVDRFELELSVIEELNFSDYFLIVWDIVLEAKKRGMMTIGRGSAANSIISFCLQLTEVDPIKYNLYFERFLNKGRSSPPDIDIDFSWKERDDIIKYVFEKYDYQNVAMISTHITFKARSAFREVAKTFGLSDREISEYSKKIPWTNANNLPNVAGLFPESRELNFNIEPWKTIVNIASKLSDLPRHLSIHPGGIVITPSPITDYTAVQYAANKGLGLIITQPDMYSIEDLGLIKIDLLSQRSLGVLRDTMSMIENNLNKISPEQI
ncbi:MAG TPA: PHP domain-containing protein [Ignavibacteriaceae bacterium]|nr:PHP domain-containing protein [Ignavibacteriaceae bacterium]